MSLAGKLIAFVGKRAAKRFDKACVWRIRNYHLKSPT